MVIDSEDKARQLARAYFSDIALYNEERLVKACQQENIVNAEHNISATQVQENIYQEMKEEIEAARQAVKSKVREEIFESIEYDTSVREFLLHSKTHVVERHARKLGWRGQQWR